MKILNLLSLFAIAFTWLLFTTSAFAQTNPQIRTCHNLGGEYLVANTTQDQIGLCQFDAAIVPTLDLMAYSDNFFPVQSLQTYLDGIQSCEPYGQPFTIKILDGRSVDICFFKDGSMIDTNTLQAGRHNPINIKLNHALGL